MGAAFNRMLQRLKRPTVVVAAGLSCFLAGGDDHLFQAQGFQAQAQTARVEFVYDKELARLSEILGALHYLHRLCDSQERDWRRFMERLIGAESGDDTRRRHFIAAFNRNYRVFAENYRQCTPAALAVIDIYTQEGVTISTALLDRYGN